MYVDFLEKKSGNMAFATSGVSLVSPNIAVANLSVVPSMRCFSNNDGFTASSAATTAHDASCRGLFSSRHVREQYRTARHLREQYTPAASGTKDEQFEQHADTYFESIKRGFFVSRGCFLSTLHV
jgi:hypothetical protein